MTHSVNDAHISYVVLHYQTYTDTLECVRSLLEISEESVIVVVDNGSPNKSGEDLEVFFENEQRVHIMISEENLGFSKGNNLGYKYCSEELKSEAIVVLNNDTFITQKEFSKRLVALTRSEKCNGQIIGPKIISSIDGRDQNPVPYNFPTRLSVIKRLLKYFVLNILASFNLDERYNRISISNNKIDTNSFQLHGSAIIFLNKFIENETNAFDPSVFMYCEEDILKENAIRKSYHLIYQDDLIVYHKEKSSTNQLYGKGKKRRKFYYRNSMKSLLYLYKLKGETNEIK